MQKIVDPLDGTKTTARELAKEKLIMLLSEYFVDLSDYGYQLTEEQTKEFDRYLNKYSQSLINYLTR